MVSCAVVLLLPTFLAQNRIETRYYIIETDLPAEQVRDAAVRIDRVAEEYFQRTRFLASGSGGVISEKLPFLLFSRQQDYMASGGLPGSSGVYMGDRLLAWVNTRGSGINWPVVYHEGFHQFAHHMIAGDLPVWVNEGLAEYFAYGVFTGDGFLTGTIPPYMAQRAVALIKTKAHRPFKDIMTLGRQNWNHAMAHGDGGTQYLQAWMMVYFLGHADDGAYGPTFNDFLALISRGRDWDQAWLATFGGGVEQFEARWRDYWLKLPKHATRDLYARATAARLTSFLARAVSQGQSFTGWDDYIAAARAGHLRHHPDDWLPPSLLTEAVEDSSGYGRWQLKQAAGAAPEVWCYLPGRRTIVGRFTVDNGRVGTVTAQFESAP